MRGIKNKFIIIFTTSILLSGFIVIAKAQSDAPQFLVSWSADSFAPSWFKGKIFPTFNSIIKVSFELVDNGKIVNLSQTPVRWYINDNLYENEQNGLGIKAISFRDNTTYNGNDINVRISIPDYNGNNLDEIITIPIKNPEVVIDSPYYNGNVSKGSYYFTVWPFFFSGSNLITKWYVNGQAASNSQSDSNIFNLAIGDQNQSPITIENQTQNLSNDLERAQKLINLNIAQ